jgi:hygromycin-B 7''-O-kinase
MSLLPQPIDSALYWRDIYKQPLPFWQPALAAIATSHDLPSEPWTRAALGRNIVFSNSTTVVKLGPPCWPGEMAREVAALRFVAGRLPVATPTLVASGTLDGWDYLVQEKLPGINLWQLWTELDSSARARLAYRHGQLMAAIHALPLSGVPVALQFDWNAMLAEQRAACADEMRRAGVEAALVQQIEPYLVAAPWSLDEDRPVLLHGDLTHLNFLVSELDGGWAITGLIDWGDVKIGPRAHEFISPGVHMYKGERAALTQWYQGYGWSAAESATDYQHVIMARAMLYYAEDFLKLIQTVQGAASCGDWPALAEAFWHLAAQNEGS